MRGDVSPKVFGNYGESLYQKPVKQTMLVAYWILVPALITKKSGS